MRVAVLMSILWAATSGTADADWDAQISSRLVLGGGAWIAEQGADPWPLFEMGLHTDVLFGEVRPEHTRFGPALDLRTEDFRTFEAAGALAVYLPTGLGYAITLTGGAGWGARPEGRDGAFALGRIAFGYRPYNYFSVYSWAINLYGSLRVQLEPDPRAWEVTIGVEVDLEFISVIPIMFIYELANAHDPDEPPDDP